MIKLDALLLERLNKLAKLRGQTYSELIEHFVTEAEIEAAYSVKQEADWAFGKTPKRSLQD